MRTPHNYHDSDGMTPYNSVPGAPPLVSTSSDDSTIHVNQMDPVEASRITRTQSAAQRLTHLLNPFSLNRRSLTGRVASGAPTPISTDDLEEQNRTLNASVSKLTKIQTELKSKTTPFPNIALEAVLAGMEKERITNDQLNQHIATAQKYQQDIDLLLDLSSELVALKDDVNEMPEKVKNLLQRLKEERGIDLWKGEGPFTKEKVSEIKSLTSAQVDKLRSNLQIVFTTKIQTLTQTISSILECIKDIIRNNSKLIGTANRIH